MFTTVDPGDKTYGIPFPGIFILDAQGRVKERFFEQVYQERSTSSSIAIRLGERGDRAGARKSTLHLEVTTFASDEVVAPGNRFSVVLDVAPRKGMHVYAPPQANYKPVAIAIKEQSGLTAHAVQFPAAEEYFFKPLKERVQVYQKPFRLVQDLTLSASRDIQAKAAAPDATLQVEGTLVYQACDEEVCYLPESVPLAWTIRLKPLLRP
jgi:DsbC/DsbD-like thiol-disulfide interchange protein